jgi:hypothetical protein
VRPRALSDVEPDFVCEVCGKRGAERAAGFQLGQEARARHGLSLMSWSRVLTTADTIVAAGWLVCEPGGADLTFATSTRFGS